MRRLFDIFAAGGALLLLALPLAIILVLVWLQDGCSPFYVAPRAGVGGYPFNMVKIRSMVVSADKSGVESTSATDNRITPLGHFIRRWKIDELSQLWNVLKGDMSLVGPRPNTLNEVATYNDEERGLLLMRPGITDFSSIVFADEGEILKDSDDPDRDYRLWIRPWKSKLGLIYAQNATLGLNFRLIWLTLTGLLSREASLRRLVVLLSRYTGDSRLLAVSERKLCLSDIPS